MNLNKKQQNKALPTELLVDIFKALNTTLNETKLNIDSTTIEIIKQLEKYSKNLLISSKILNIIAGKAFNKRKKQTKQKLDDEKAIDKLSDFFLSIDLKTMVEKLMEEFVGDEPLDPEDFDYFCL
uniref:Uncharacterized protein n=1 Tax=Meloidogyne hapla TaxID=6305 RepID=A0A1I8BZT4_MELHA